MKAQTRILILAFLLSGHANWILPTCLFLIGYEEAHYLL
jgi:hypothetical protein